LPGRTRAEVVSVYETHYGFTEKPFNLTPDPKYLFFSQRHSEAFAHLEFGRREKGGFIAITGEVGTGKTTLARCFLSRLDARTATAFVLYPALSGEELLRSILQDLHIPVTGTSLKDHVDALHRFLLEARAQDRDVVLLLDEAQDLRAEVLEQVRLISNLETDTEKLIQIVLMGQSELHEMLGRRDLRQLAQRVTARFHLTPLDRGETEAYVKHRLAVAGGEGKVMFTADALTAVHQVTGGVPRLINLVCDRALLAGYVRGSREITQAMVKQAAREAIGEAPKRSSWTRAGALAAGAAGLVLAALAGAAVARLSAGPASRVVAEATPSPPPTTVAPIAVATPAPAVQPAPLEPFLLSLDRDASWRVAESAVQPLWGGVALERTTLRTHLDQVRALNLPVILEMFHPARRDTCFVALVRLEDGNAMLAQGSGAPLPVSEADLDRLWTRQAVFLWRDFDSLGADAGSVRTAAWARESLGRLGYLDQDRDLAGAIARFQRDANLSADGVIGARTLMTLYSRGSYPRPRLTGGTS
jgi:general secretion pathway protein A